jgi:hydroxyacylglutathione hydrolase
MKKQIFVITLGLVFSIGNVMCFDQSASAASEPVKSSSGASSPDKGKGINAKKLTVSKLKPGIWSLYDGEVRCFLFTGTKRALLLDTGFGEIRIDEAVKELTGLPLYVVNSHTHPDHTGGDKFFKEIYVHPLGKDHVKHPKIFPVREGMVFDLGGRKLTVIELPGHSSDHIGLIDYDAGAIFTGDMIEFEKGMVRSLPAYIKSVERVLALQKDKISEVYPSHGACPISMDRIPDLLELLQAVNRGELKSEPVHIVVSPELSVDTFVYRYKNVSIYYNPAGGEDK